MTAINFTNEDLELKAGESLMMISLKGKQLAIKVTDKEISEWDEDPYSFSERYMPPCLRKLAAELAL